MPMNGIFAKLLMCATVCGLLVVWGHQAGAGSQAPDGEGTHVDGVTSEPNLGSIEGGLASLVDDWSPYIVRAVNEHELESWDGTLRFRAHPDGTLRIDTDLWSKARDVQIDEHTRTITFVVDQRRSGFDGAWSTRQIDIRLTLLCESTGELSGSASRPSSADPGNTFVADISAVPWSRSEQDVDLSFVGPVDGGLAQQLLAGSPYTVITSSRHDGEMWDYSFMFWIDNDQNLRVETNRFGSARDVEVDEAYRMVRFIVDQSFSRDVLGKPREVLVTLTLTGESTGVLEGLATGPSTHPGQAFFDDLTAFPSDR